MTSTPIDGVFCHVYQPRVLLDLVDQQWREDRLEDDDLDIAVDPSITTPQDDDDEAHTALFAGVGLGMGRGEAWHDLQLHRLIGDGRATAVTAALDGGESHLLAMSASARQ